MLWCQCRKCETVKYCESTQPGSVFSNIRVFSKLKIWHRVCQLRHPGLDSSLFSVECIFLPLSSAPFSARTKCPLHLPSFTIPKLGLALADLEWPAIRAGGRQIGNGDRMAATGIPTFIGAATQNFGPSVSREVMGLIRKVSVANPRWGAPRIHGELLKLGFELTEATAADYVVRPRKPAV